MSSFLLVHLGPKVPDYLGDCIGQIRSFNPDTPIILVIDQTGPPMSDLAARYNVQLFDVGDHPRSEVLVAYDQLSRNSRTWRDGFNFYAMQRFFHIESAMRSLGLSNVIHLEYDNTIYFEINSLMVTLDRHFEQLGLVLDNDGRCIPGIVYIADSKAILNFTQWYVENCLGTVDNDMSALALYRWKKLGKGPQLPLVFPGMLPRFGTRFAMDGSRARKVMNYEALATEFGGIFDAAAIGQYLGGVDPRNQTGDTRGFLNEACIFSPEKLEVVWLKDEAGRRKPFVRLGSGPLWQVLNLHVHSKDLKPFLS